MVICSERGADLHMDAIATHRLVLPFWYRLTRVVPDKGPSSAQSQMPACRRDTSDVAAAVVVVVVVDS